MTNIDNQDINKYIKCSRCHMKFINDDEHIKNDFGYNRLNERYKQCVRCRTKRTEYRNNNIEHARKMDKIYYENNKEQKLAYNAEIIECDVCGKHVRRESMKQHKMSLNCINNCNECHLCGKKVSFKSMDKHVDSSLCKRKRNIDKYLEIFGSYNIMDQTHIANGGTDFDRVIKLEQHEK